jgi:hypothetical protein
MARMNSEFLEIIRTEAEVAMVFGGMTKPLASDLARSICERIMLRAGGSEHYVPQRDAGLARQQALEALAKGDTVRQVCARHGISRRTLQTWRSDR